VAAQPLAIDLFAGAGGFSLGFKQAGWHVIAANECDADAAHTYLCNLGSPHTRIVFCTPEDEDRWTRRHRRLERYHAHRDRPPLDPGSGWIAGQDGVRPCEVFFFGDVRALTGEQILDELGLQSDDIGCVFGGPPCQGFSKAGRRQPEDPRNELVFEFMRIVCEIHPRSFCMENVPGMLDMSTRDGVPVIDALALMAQKGGMGTFEAIRRALPKPRASALLCERCGRQRRAANRNPASRATATSTSRTSSFRSSPTPESPRYSDRFLRPTRPRRLLDDERPG
jgi:DNA (cytosine-5)-methyltransferase 1